ncbi:MAG: hypothetical protein JXA54_15575 [Candidatus Heimdallarchaeota archaeon]|nr:hypothetical protein [Candidatus Heimdallarchaeota archaeon]
MVEVVVQQIREDNSQNMKGFILSIIFSCVGISVLLLLLSFIPILKEGFWSSESLPTHNTNFFYKWNYVYSSWHTSYMLSIFKPSMGYFIFTPFVALLLLISNSGVLVQNKEKTRKLIFINLGLNALPIVCFIIKLILLLVFDEITTPYLVSPLLTTLGFYSLIFLPIQIILLAEKKTFREFFALQRKENSLEVKGTIRRRVNAIFATLIYLYSLGLLFHSIYFNELELFTLRNILAVVILLLIWFTVNIATFRYNFLTPAKKNFFSFFTGIASFTVVYSIMWMTDPLMGMEFSSFNTYDIQFPKTLVMTLFYSTIILLISIPIGFFGSNKKMIAIIVSIFAAIISVYSILIIINLFDYDYLTQNSKIFYVFIRLYYLLLVYAGAYWGDFLGKEVYSNKKIKQTYNLDFQ